MMMLLFSSADALNHPWVTQQCALDNQESTQYLLEAVPQELQKLVGDFVNVHIFIQSYTLYTCSWLV